MKREIERLEVPNNALSEFIRIVTAHDDLILTTFDKKLKKHFSIARTKCKPARKGQINGSGDPTKKKVKHEHRIVITYTPYFKQLLDKQKELNI